MIQIALTTLAVSVAAVFASEQHDNDNGPNLLRGASGGSNIPELFGAEQLVDITQISKPKPCFTTDSSCSNGEYCYKPIGICFRDVIRNSHCLSERVSCTFELNEQCGCDGKTYLNPCTARLAGENVAYTGKCRAQTSISCTYSGVGSNTCSSGQYCFINTGKCLQSSASQPGVCQAKSVSCTFELNEQCGCDGKTYLNSCDANRAGVNIAHAGPCRTQSPTHSPTQSLTSCTYSGVGSNTCSSGQYCFINTGLCLQPIANQSGVCQAMSIICTNQMDPQCGCDGKTYSSSCKAARAGVNIAYKGRCDTQSPTQSPTQSLTQSLTQSVTSCTYSGEGSNTCSSGQYCFINTGLCLQPIANQSGVCQVMSSSCSADSTPQCGCDGKTYMNPCDAASAGVNIAYAGQCTV